MFELICVTSRALCTGDLVTRIGALARAGIDHIILREKDLPEAEYEALARRALAAAGERLILHQFPAVCRRTGTPRLHLSLAALEAAPALREETALLGVSIHTPEEALRAQSLGADYVTAGHVFYTDCKRGLPGRGLSFLRETCAAVSIPVYAIGGIGADNLSRVRDAGAAGACLMSTLMSCAHPEQTLEQLRKSLG